MGSSHQTWPNFIILNSQLMYYGRDLGKVRHTRNPWICKEVKRKKKRKNKKKNKGRHGTDPWLTSKCLDIFPTPQHLQNMPSTAVSSLRLGGDRFVHVCSMNLLLSHPKEWPHDHGPTNVRVMVKREETYPVCFLIC